MWRGHGRLRGGGFRWHCIRACTKTITGKRSSQTKKFTIGGGLRKGGVGLVVGVGEVGEQLSGGGLCEVKEAVNMWTHQDTPQLTSQPDSVSRSQGPTGSVVHSGAQQLLTEFRDDGRMEGSGRGVVPLAEEGDLGGVLAVVELL